MISWSPRFILVLLLLRWPSPLGCEIQNGSWTISAELPLAHGGHPRAGPSVVEGPQKRWMEGQGLLPLVPPAQAADWIHQVRPDTAALKRWRPSADRGVCVCVCQGSLLRGFRFGGRHRGDHWHQHERRQAGSVLLQPGEHHLVQSEVPLQRWEAARFLSPPFRSPNVRDAYKTPLFQIKFLKTTRTSMPRTHSEALLQQQQQRWRLWKRNNDGTLSELEAFRERNKGHYWLHTCNWSQHISYKPTA